MIDFVSPAERIKPPSRWFSNFCLGLWLRYNLKCAKWELGKVEEANRTNIAGQWRALVVSLSDKLKSLGIDPEEEITDLTKTLEIWLVVGILICALVAIVMLQLYRAELVNIIQTRM